MYNSSVFDYFKNFLTNISSDINEKKKSLQPGTCVAFGKAFKVPMIIKMQMPDPEPSSSSCNVASVWQVSQATTTQATSVQPGIVQN